MRNLLLVAACCQCNAGPSDANDGFWLLLAGVPSFSGNIAGNYLKKQT